MYFVHIYDHNWNAVTTLLESDIEDLQYTNELNKIGSATFKIVVAHEKATPVNFQLYNRIVIEKAGLGKFVGYIEEIGADVNILDIRCLGILGLFNKRLTSTNISGQNASDAFFDLLTATNLLDDTGIAQGDSDVSYTINSVNFSRSSIMSAFSKIAEMSGNKEFYVDPLTRLLHFKNAIGSDISTLITLFYDVNQLERSTVYDFQVNLSGKDLANSVTGVGDSLTSVQSDATSKSTYGLLEASQSFSQTANSGNLDDETQNYVDAHKDPLYTPAIKINTEKIDPDTISVGDIVGVYLNNGFISIDATHRVIKKTVTINDSGQEEMSLDLIDSTKNILPKLPLIGDISELLSRVSLLEGQQ